MGERATEWEQYSVPWGCMVWHGGAQNRREWGQIDSKRGLPDLMVPPPPPSLPVPPSKLLPRSMKLTRVCILVSASTKLSPPPNRIEKYSRTIILNGTTFNLRSRPSFLELIFGNFIFLSVICIYIATGKWVNVKKRGKERGWRRLREKRSGIQWCGKGTGFGCSD